MFQQPTTLVVKKAIKNQIFFNYLGDLTGKVVLFRFKTALNDDGVPLIEGTATVGSITPTKSVFYIFLDLSQTEQLKNLIGQAWIDFVITFTGDPCPSVTLPKEIEIVTTLKRGI